MFCSPLVSSGADNSRAHASLNRKILIGPDVRMHICTYFQRQDRPWTCVACNCYLKLFKRPSIYLELHVCRRREFADQLELASQLVVNMGGGAGAGAGGICKAGRSSAAIICMWMVVCVNVVIRAGASCYDGRSKVQLTKYWIPEQGSDDVDDEGRVIHLRGPATKRLVDSQGHVLAMVDRNTNYKCLLEGTCLLKDGRLLNVGERDDVFVVVDRRRFPFGIGARDNPIVPYTSVASNDLPLFSKVFVPSLKGRKLPNGKTHNGCVRVDDKLSERTGCHLDFFLPTYDVYKTFGLALPDSTPAVAHSDCRPLRY